MAGPSLHFMFGFVPVEKLSAEEYLFALKAEPEILDRSYRAYAFMYLPTREITDIYLIPAEAFDDAFGS